jgi:hypothetical protein
MKRIIRHAQVNDADGSNLMCADKMCEALAAVLLYPSTHERMLGKE